MAPVERIEEAIANGVRAGGIVATMWQAVHELLANSIDAGAVSVEIKLDIPCYRFSVSDNGHGIPGEKLRDLVGTQRATSKAGCYQEMQPGRSYGFRGEALLSLGLTSLLEIQSRCEGRDARGKVVREGRTLHFGPATAPARTGTIVTVRDAFFKWPVRRKAINEATEMLRIKEQVARMALVNNSVSITVVDSAKSKTVLRATASGSVIRAFSQVFASDKLSMAQKVAFEFKQFQITGYLSPPSSTACHWSKEFQILYVNRRCVRRLDFLHKTINAAFAPCLALLAGRGGSDGQGIVRRARDPNASSGQRQGLFPVFVLNLECRRGEVDVMADPDKTLVEFCDWPSARNAPVALLLAFLPRFPHAVPSTVLRDLRRAFHKNESEEKWTAASPPAPVIRAERSSPESSPPPPPTPSPMRLAMPDVGVPSPLYGCDSWMGRDRDSGGIVFDRDLGPMASGGYEIPVEGDARPCAFPCPCSSPASRFGARDSCSAPAATVSMHLSGNVLAEVDASPYFCGRWEDGGCGGVDGPDHDRWDPRSGRDGSLTSSPYFDSFDSRSRASRRWMIPQRRCSLGRRLAETLIEFKGSDCLGDSRGSEAVLSDAASSCSAKDIAGEIDAEIEKSESLAPEAQNIRDRVGSQEDRAEKAPETRFESVLLSPPLSPVQPSFDTSLVRPLIDCRAPDERCSGRASPFPSGAVQHNLRGSWLRSFSGASEKIVRSAGGKGDVGTDTSAEEGKNGRGLSRLFDFAFTDKDRRQFSEQPTLQRGECRDGRGYTPSASVSAAAGASGAERAPRRSTSPRRLFSGRGSVTATELQALVGVTVRRPPSPQFSFMNKGVELESSQPSCLERPSPWSSSPLREVRERENGTPSQYCDPEASGASQGVIHGKSCDETEPPPGGDCSPTRTMGEGVASRGSGKRPASPTETGSALTPSRRIKRRRPDWPLAESTGERERFSGDVGQPRWEPPTLLELKRLTVESPQRRHRADADRRLTPIREGPFASRGKRKVCSTDGGWTLDASSTPCDNETAIRPSHDNAVGYQGDAATGDIDRERRSEILHENRDWVRNDSLLELRTEEATRLSERYCDTGLEGGGMLGEGDESGQQQTKELRDDLGTESMGYDGQGIKPVCRTSRQDTKSHHPAPSTGKLPRETVPVLAPDAALAYDRDTLGGDGVTDGAIGWLGSGEGLVPPDTCDGCQVSDPGGAAVSSFRGPGGIRARQLGRSARLSKGSRSSLVGVKEKPIPEILQPGQDEIGAGVEAMPVTVTPGDLKKARVIGQAGRKFILLRAGTGALLCVDQHAADERIKLEELERQVLGDGKSSRNIKKLVLTPPESIKITSSDKELLEQHRKVLSAWHFDIAVEQAEGNDTSATVPQATLLAVPVICGVRLSVQDLLGFLRYLRESVEPGSCPRWLRPPQVQHILNYKACHSAIRFGDVLTQSSCVDLIHKLALCARPFSCAHGRPSVAPLCVLGLGNASLKQSLTSFK